MQNTTLEKPIVTTAQEGKDLAIMGCTHKQKVLVSDSDGAFALQECVIPPGFSIPMHMHTMEDEIFYVLEGTLELQLAGVVRQMGAGATAFFPKGVPHRFGNPTDNPTKILLMMTPGNFERFFEMLDAKATDPTFGIGEIIELVDRDYGCTFNPETWSHIDMSDTPGLYGAICGPREGRHTPFMGGRIEVKIEGNSTNGEISVFDGSLPAGSGPEDHMHQTFSEVFYVLEGEFAFRVDGKEYIGRPGTAAYVPKGVTHSFKVLGTTPGRVLNYILPAGFENFFFEVQALEQAGNLNWETLGQLAAQYDTVKLPASE